MPGIATNFKILELTIDQLLSSGSSDLHRIGEIMRDNSSYAYLGSVGPAIADFMPSDLPADPTGPGSAGYSNFFKSIWAGAFRIVSGDGTDTDPGLLKILDSFNSFFDQIQPIMDDEDLFALKDMRDSGKIDVIIDIAQNLKDAVTNLTSPLGFVLNVAGLIGDGMKPAVNVDNGKPIPAPEVWAARDFLFWKKTGDFSAELVKKAETSGDERFMAYAYGYVSSYAGNIAGSSFINTIIGGTFRSDWWRYRWINNFVDAWVYGFYDAGASISGDTPTPGYDDWKSLCNAQLQSKIDFPGIDADDIMSRMAASEPFPQILPQEFDDYWFSAFDAVYGPRSPLSRFKPKSTNSAYIMTWMMLWFQTSGKVVGCNTAPPMSPPKDCGDMPSWVDPTKPGDNGTGSVPPEPTIEKDVDEGKVITGIILALLGLGGLLTGGLIAGGTAIVGGVELIIVGASEINWNKLRCDVYWYRIYLYNGLKALHDIMVLGGLQYPYGPELGNDSTVMNFLGTDFTFDSGRNTVKSKEMNNFPPIPWDGKYIPVSNLWSQAPSRPVEEPATIAYKTSGKYPDYFINDNINNPILNKDIKTSSPVFNTPDGGSLRLDNNLKEPVQFGNAVANTIDLLRNKSFVNWNLDSDRGLAYFTWQFDGPGGSPIHIKPEV